jgi:hypothetical protein
LNYHRRCNLCGSPLPGGKGHGFVTPAGIVCSNWKYHDRLKRQQKYKNTFDKETEDMLYFEAIVSDIDENLLVEVN